MLYVVIYHESEAGEVRRGYQGVETLEFSNFIITQFVYVIVTFKSTISIFYRTYLAHISAPTSFKFLGI